MSISWEKTTKETFDKMIEKTPIWIREMAKDKVSKRAELIVQESNRKEVTEKDVVDAFFKETPGGFWGPLKVDMEAIGLDYQKYGYER